MSFDYLWLDRKSVEEEEEEEEGAILVFDVPPLHMQLGNLYPGAGDLKKIRRMADKLNHLRFHIVSRYWTSPTVRPNRWLVPFSGQ